MDALLQGMVESWKEVPPYEDVVATTWIPGQDVPDHCPAGCALADTGWVSMVGGRPAVDAYRRTLYCRVHGFARILVISGPEAAEHGWAP